MTGLLSTIRRSLFLRLLLIFGITVILFVVIISISLGQINRNDSTEIVPIPDYFTRNIESIIDDIGTPPNLESAMVMAQDLDWTIRISSPIMQWKSDGDDRLDVEYAAYSRSLSTDAEIRTVSNEDIISVDRGGYQFYLYRRSLDSNEFNYVALYIGLSMAALVLFLNYFMVNNLLNPVRLLKRGAERIRNGDLNYRVQSNRQDELGELTESINHMADSLQSMLEAKRQLLLAISHELRTPITKAKLRLEFMPDSNEKTALGEDINEIELLISDLIEAERLNDDHSALIEETVELAQFIASVLEQYDTYEGGLKFISADEDQLFAIDKLRIRLLITNLINNAIRHGEGKPIEVKLEFSDDRALLLVCDHGEGIAAKHLAQISEPFYRADSARQRNTGGFGLGLYLCKLIAEAHGGKLKIASKLGQGTEISVILPQRKPTEHNPAD